MSSFEGNFWDVRYSNEEFIYGKEPNSFFKEQIDKLQPGKLLMLGEGEGRNAVYAAKKGWRVDAFDFSSAAKKKALNWAEQNNVVLNYTVSNLIDYTPKNEFYDAAGLIFIHLNPENSHIVFHRLSEALVPKGKIIMEVFSKNQLGKTSGGPQDLSVLYSVDEIKNYFYLLNIIKLEERTVLLNEGKHHAGEACVISFIGEKR